MRNNNRRRLDKTIVLAKGRLIHIEKLMELSVKLLELTREFTNTMDVRPICKSQHCIMEVLFNW
jgi:hypothetical protein